MFGSMRIREGRGVRRMAPRVASLLALSSLVWLVLMVGAFPLNVESDASTTRTYIVQMEEAAPAVAPLGLTKAAWYTQVLQMTKLQFVQESPSLAGENKIGVESLLHVYETVLHGFSARMTFQEAAYMENLPGVAAVYPDGVKHLHTTHTPEFLGLNSSYGLWPEAHYGDDVIVGVLDTGVWPESASFGDQHLGPIPARWKGICEGGTEFNVSNCNKKLIGARYYAKGYEAATGAINETKEYKSPRDSEGHGTHTASTAAGRWVYKASLMGLAEGTARGMSPRARVAVYKVCWDQGCFDSDILAAFDQAVADGVDVISLSVGGGVVPYYVDSIAIGAFGAVRKGVFVSCSAGNSGPGPGTVSNIAPWITTVGASTLDRGFPANVILGDGVVVHGVSLYKGKGLGNDSIPLIYAGHAAIYNASNVNSTLDATLCMAGTLNPALVKGKIVLCERGNNARVAKGAAVLAAGGAGMILANTPTDGEGLIADSHVLPGTSVGAKGGFVILNYINSTTSPTANIEFGGTVLGVKPAPVVASFSSRGPNTLTPQILKPDLVGPGVNILAAWTGRQGPTGLSFDTRRVPFNIISGTSMSCPHISGIGALMKGAHPHWSPAAIRSAMMTTASTVDNRNGMLTDESTSAVGNPFDYGAGAVEPEKAVDPGLIYDLGPQDYVNFLCALNYTETNIQAFAHNSSGCPATRVRVEDMNYPSFSAVFNVTGASGEMSTTFRRTVTNVGPANSTYSSIVSAPKGIAILVDPDILKFSTGTEKLSFRLNLSASISSNTVPGVSETMFASLSWSDGVHVVQSQISITKQS